ncbi:lipopolysaccharide heptosyltransferase II [Beggiatoa leptomitoformis]|uniref:lipopolysaccharide heptosyltransferase II n=1 Tax=Beggiatoa leptomitoformis TaxID=288004 RepID=A0A2N9YCC9_9GAMM|nr:lipopolysaccharide heptosyltransferase II [Beggiatoa leptomitoformis]ALG66585.1 lipopolysaccharide heptosyltransferase II [Beggiatoa leptomitoformis]AUI68109.1 lipopolysaccharide heptosyltransferase II [Beggiatoa leptomitoformis]
MSESTSATLIVAPSWVGDMVMAQSLFKLLHTQAPTSAIDVLTPRWSAGLLQRMPEVRTVIEHDIAHGQFAWRARRQLGRALNGHYQRAIILPNSWKSALIPFWAKIPQRIGFLGEWRYGILTDARRKDKRQYPKTVEQFIALALPANTPVTTYPRPQLYPHPANTVLHRLGLTKHAPLLVLCPGAEYGIAKRWPPTYFADIADYFIQQGGQVWLLGSQKDAPIGQEIINTLKSDNCKNLCGLTNLAEAVDIMALADTVISNDSGLMHVAAALDKPLIALYGSSDPNMTPPLHPAAQILYLGLPCSPCFKRVCPLGDTRCLQDLKPERVIQILRATL